MLMDEPFGAIDPINRENLQNQFLRLQSELRKTIVFVTHDIDEAILLGDRVYVMTGRPGRIQKEIAIGFPHPRSMELVLDPQFLMIKRRILQLLHGDLDEDV